MREFNYQADILCHLWKRMTLPRRRLRPPSSRSFVCDPVQASAHTASRASMAEESCFRLDEAEGLENPFYTSIHRPDQTRTNGSTAACATPAGRTGRQTGVQKVESPHNPVCQGPPVNEPRPGHRQPGLKHRLTDASSHVTGSEESFGAACTRCFVHSEPRRCLLEACPSLRLPRNVTCDDIDVDLNKRAQEAAASQMIPS